MKNYEKVVNALLGRISDSGVASENKTALIEFDRYNKTAGKSGSTRFNYLNTLRRLAEFREKRTFKEMTREDIQDFIDYMDTKSNGKSKSMHRINTKAFFKWLEGEDEDYPKKVSWINNKAKSLRAKSVQPSDLPTEDDIERMIKSCDLPRDRLIISLLGELGFRAGELESIRLKDVQFFDDYAIVTVNGKTGQRSLRAYGSAPLIKMVYTMHPDYTGDPKHDRYSDSPLFMNSAKKHNPLGYMGIYKVIKEAANAAGLKNMHPHLFRHAALTRMGRHMTDPELRVFAGWSGGSQQTKTYCHLTAGDIQERQGQIEGRETKKTDIKEAFRKTAKCGRCGNENEGKAKFCAICGYVMDKDMRDKMEAERIRKEQAAKLPFSPEDIEILKELMADIKKAREDMKNRPQGALPIGTDY